MERTRCLMVLVFVLAFGLTAGTANAAATAVEEFEYTVGQDLDGQDGGIGWAGPWGLEHSDDMADGIAIIQADSLVHPTIIMPTGVGGHVLTDTSPTSEAARDRTMVTPILDAGGPGQAWISYLFTIESEAIDEGNWRALSLFGAPGWGSVVAETGQSYGVETFGFGFDVESGVPITVGQVYWIVVKVEFSGDATDDTVYLWVDPDPAGEPSTSSPTVSAVTDGANDGLNRIMIIRHSNKTP